MTVSPLPLDIIEPVEDDLIVLQILDGKADTTIAHLPMRERQMIDGRGGCRVRWADYEDPPARWRGECGVDGWVYNRGGTLANIEICGACEAARVSLTNYVPERNRVYVRRFDHEEVAARLDAGETLSKLATEYGVSQTAIRRVRHKQRDIAYDKKWRTGVCEDCGGKAMRLIGGKKEHNRDGRQLCARCRGKLRRKELADVGGVLHLHCGTCGETKPLSEHMPRTRRKVMAGKAVGKSRCRACETRARQEYRERHKVPCESCGTLCLPANEKRTRGGTAPRCRECFYEDQRRARRAA